MIQRMPRLLDGAMQARERLNPVRANVQMNLTPLSTASLTLPPDDPEVSARDFVAVYAPDESYGVYRVTSIRTAYGDQRQVTLEEGICTLEDDLTAEDTVLNGDMQAVLETLLAFQTNKRWQLGTIASEAQFTDVEAARVNVLEAVLDAVAADDTVMMVRDYSRTPWVLNVVKKPESVSCECRLNRNLNNVTATLDDSELCTRVTVVPDEGEAFEMDADTVNTWGVVHREITVEEGKDPEAEARKYLEAHKNPALSVECDALALAELTGEAWDSFALGQLCAVALPAFGVVLRERIVTVYYSDLFADPRHVRLTLSTQAADASSALASLGAATKSNSKGLGRAFKHITETDNAVMIQAEEIMLRATTKQLEEVNGALTAKYNDVSIELNAQKAELTLKASQEVVDNMNYTLSQAEIKLSGAEATITEHAEKLDKLTGDLSSAELKIDGANASITAEVKRAMDKEDELAASIQINADGITQTVKKGELISQINQSAEEVKISASRVNLDGYVTATALTTKYLTAEYIQAAVAEILSVYTGGLSAENLRFDSANGLEANIDDITASTIYAESISGTKIGGTHVYAGELDLGTHYHLFTPKSDGTIEIGGPSATAGSFNIADTKFYKDGVSAARTAGAKSVSLDHITTNYVPSFDPNSLTVNVFLTNGEHFTQAVDVANVYNAGAASVSVAEDSSHIKWQTNVRKIGSIDGTVTVILSNGNEYSRPVTSITAPAVRSVNVNTATDKVTVYYANVTSGYTSSDVFDW